MHTATRFLTNANGETVAAVIPIHEYEEFQEDLNDLAVLAGRPNDPRVFIEFGQCRTANSLLAG
jgi:hypothetical protein